jgi:hypothetical protein
MLGTMATDRDLHGIDGDLHGRERPAGRTSAWLFAGLAIVGIWVSVLLASTFSPDFVSGSQQEHLPLVGWLDWVWGLVATAFVVLVVVKGVRAGAPSATPWIALALGGAFVWTLVFVVSVLGPVFVTGTDPTRIPIVALGVPILGVFLTWLLCALIRSGLDRHAG